MENVSWDASLEIGDAAQQYVLQNLNFNSVIDIGCGRGRHSERFRSAGKKVYSVDFAGLYEKAHKVSFEEFYETYVTKRVDLIWCSHVLEHVHDVQSFLKKARDLTNINGYIAVTVPPLKHQIVGGHITLWNAGLVMYNLILAGFDCSNARIKQCGYNITVIAQAKEFELPKLDHDRGDIEKLAEWFPEGCRHQGFNGNIKSLNME